MSTSRGLLSDRGLRPARAWAVAVVAAALLSLASCATPTGAGTGSPTPSATGSAPSPDVTSAEPEVTAEPAPTESATVVTPYNGDVLVVTSEIIDGRLEVTAMIPGVSETGGTCLLEVTGLAASTSVTGNAGHDVTYCGLMAVPLDPGTNSAEFRVSYSSESTQARSAVSSVETAG